MQLSQQNFRNIKSCAISNRHSTHGTRTWVVIADYKIARIFSMEDNLLIRINEIRPDKYAKFPGFLFRGAGNVHRTGDIHFMHDRANLFIAKIINWLAVEAHNDEYDRLVIVASPGMLENLRRNMPRSLRSRIKADAARDMTGIDDGNLYSELRKIVRI